MKTLLSVVVACLVLAFSGSVFANQISHVLAKKSITTSQMEKLYQYNKVNMSSNDEGNYQANNDEDNDDEDDNSQESNNNTQNQGSDGTQSYDNGNSDDQGYNESGTW